MYTMEAGLYDVDARDLSFIVRYPDVQRTGDRFISGYHGKGAYTGQGLLVVSNNGRAYDQGNPRGPSGVLATWDGTTVADNTPSDPFIMFGYDRKELTLHSSEPTTISVEVDFFANNTWSTYKTSDLEADQTATHLFPEGFHAHWVRVKASSDTTANAQFKYGPDSE